MHENGHKTQLDGMPASIESWRELVVTYYFREFSDWIDITAHDRESPQAQDANGYPPFIPKSIPILFGEGMDYPFQCGYG